MSVEEVAAEVLRDRAATLSTPSAEHLAALAEAARETGLTVRMG